MFVQKSTRWCQTWYSALCLHVYTAVYLSFNSSICWNTCVLLMVDFLFCVGIYMWCIHSCLLTWKRVRVMTKSLTVPVWMLKMSRDAASLNVLAFLTCSFFAPSRAMIETFSRNPLSSAHCVSARASSCFRRSILARNVVKWPCGRGESLSEYTSSLNVLSIKLCCKLFISIKYVKHNIYCRTMHCHIWSISTTHTAGIQAKSIIVRKTRELTWVIDDGLFKLVECQCNS